MSPLIFAYVVVFTLLLAGAAAAFEWGTRGRTAARHVWTVAVVASVITPAALLVWNTGRDRAGSVMNRAQVNAAPMQMVLTTGKTAIADAGRLAKRDDVLGTLVPNRRSAREQIAQWNEWLAGVMLPVWGLLSVSLLAWLAIGVARWHRASRSWERSSVDGINVDISAATGPAVLGILSQRIVLPKWIAELQPEHRQLILAHESEHIKARDPQRLALSIAAIVLMPWNLGLWLCVAKLRRAVELDCDARVLRRFPGAKEYGYVLLEVAARAQRCGRLSVPLIALMGLPSELETRLRAMTRPRSASLRMIVAGGVVAAVSIATAFSTPVPRLHGERGLTALRSAARFTPFRNAYVAPRDTIPSRASVSATERLRSVDSVKALIHALQETTVQLERAESELANSRETLLAAANSFPIPDSMRARVTAAFPQMWGAQFAAVAAAHTPALTAEALRASEAKLARFQRQAESAVRNRYPAIIRDRTSAAVIWLLADSGGRVIDSRYHPGYPRPLSSIERVAVQFPKVNRGAVDAVAMMGAVAGRENIAVIWVQLKGDPSQYFTPSPR